MALQPNQTVYTEYMEAFVEGMVPNSEKNNIISRSVENEEGIGFGIAVIRGTEDKQILPAEEGGSFLGVTVRDSTQFADIYPQFETAAVITKGTIVVKAGVAVDAGDPVSVLEADGTWGKAAADSITVAGAVWDTSAGAGELAVIRLG